MLHCRCCRTARPARLTLDAAWCFPGAEGFRNQRRSSAPGLDDAASCWAEIGKVRFHLELTMAGVSEKYFRQQDIWRQEVVEMRQKSRVEALLM